MIFGPKRLPELGRSAGNGFREFKSSITGAGDEDEQDGSRKETSPKDHELPKGKLAAVNRS